MYTDTVDDLYIGANVTPPYDPAGVTSIYLVTRTQAQGGSTVSPNTDNDCDLGNATHRWRTFWTGPVAFDVAHGTRNTQTGAPQKQFNAYLTTINSEIGAVSTGYAPPAGKGASARVTYCGRDLATADVVSGTIQGTLANRSGTVSVVGFPAVSGLSGALSLVRCAVRLTISDNVLCIAVTPHDSSSNEVDWQFWVEITEC
jgi:hypothetical protein